MQGPDLLCLTRDPWPKPHEATRVHHAARRHGRRLATCGACTALLPYRAILWSTDRQPPRFRTIQVCLEDAARRSTVSSGPAVLGGTCSTGNGASSLRLSAARRCGRSPPARNRASTCAASACSMAVAATIRNIRPAWQRSSRPWRNWDGPMAATCGSTSAGPPMPTIFADMRQNWLRSRQTSSWLRLAPQRRRRCYRRPALCRSCL
jgi:hypothetical protein